MSRTVRSKDMLYWGHDHKDIVNEMLVTDDEKGLIL